MSLYGGWGGVGWVSKRVPEEVCHRTLADGFGWRKAAANISHNEFTIKFNFICQGEGVRRGDPSLPEVMNVQTMKVLR